MSQLICGQILQDGRPNIYNFQNQIQIHLNKFLLPDAWQLIELGTARCWGVILRRSLRLASELEKCRL